VPLAGLIADRVAAEGSEWVSTCGPAVAVGLIA
jgi:hypothetical protein